MGATKDADHSADTIEFLQKRMLEFAERFRLLAESWRGDQFGLEAAAAALGHDDLSATKLYRSKRLSLAKTVARETG